MDNSRASSVEHEVGNLSLDDELDTDFDAADKPKKRGRKVKTASSKLPINKRNTSMLRLSKQSSFEDSNNEALDSASSTPPPPPPSSEASSTGGRPQRTAAATANAISEAQSNDNKNKAKSMHLGRKKKNAGIAARIAGLDLLHEATMANIGDSNRDNRAPAGCVNERLNQDHPKDLVHEELTTSLVAGEDGKPIPFQLQVHLDKLKKQYLNFIKHMQDPLFKEKIQKDIEDEKAKKKDLVKREKQLKAQIDNLINDSLNLLKQRLSELGIQAKTPPEFIEKAKGIVCQHHELQRNRASVENEVRQLELEQEKIIQTKEKEMMDHLLKQGYSMPEARRRVKLTIENTINSLMQGSTENKPNLLLNKLADVTLTKCNDPSGNLQIRKRPVIAKQRDWPEKKLIKDEANEEKNPEVLAKKIIAEGRSLESSSMTMKANKTTPAVEVRRIEGQPRLVDLPRVDLSSSLSNMQSQNNQQQAQEPMLVLPPHPRSRSSEHTEDIPTYHTNKMSSAPRAEQFEVRLKTIIHSVLSSDEKDVKPPLQSSQSSSSSGSKPMFSPVKKELPSHLPLPPSGINLDKFKRSSASSSSGSVTLPQMGSARTMHEIIEKEIERNLANPDARAQQQHHQQQRQQGGGLPGAVPVSSPALSPQKLARASAAASTMSRMSQVIEDSIRGQHPDSRPTELEGLACPRTKSPTNNPPPPLPPNKHQGYRLNGGGNNDDFHEYPAMEGLGARFGSYMAKRQQGSEPPPSSHHWEQHPPSSSYRYPGHFQQQQFNPNVPHRKRASPSSASSSMPVSLPPKKQHMDPGGLDYSFPKGSKPLNFHD